MSRLRRSFFGETLRLILAAVVLMAGVASARLQGEMSAVQIASGDHAILCVTDPSAPPGGPGSPHDQHCLLCTLLFAAAPETPSVRRVNVGFGTIDAPAHVSALAATSFAANFARGPPCLG